MKLYSTQISFKGFGPKLRPVGMELDKKKNVEIQPVSPADSRSHFIIVFL